MRPWLGLLVLAGAVLGAQALPPIITVKNLKTKTGPAFTWKVTSRVSSPLRGALYPGQTAVTKVDVDILRTSAGKGYVVTGKLVVTNPPQNAGALTVTALKASFSPVVPLLTPQPQQLDCPQKSLLPGESLSCSFKLDLSSNVVTTITPLVHVRDLPQLQGEPLQLKWPSEEEEQLPGSSNDTATDNCALVQNQIIAGDLQSMIKITTAKEFEDLLLTGLEVCSDSTSLSYNVEVGPFEESSGLCGTYTVKDLPIVRLAAGSIGSSSVTQLSLPITFSGCRQKDLLGGRKPAIAITKLTMAKLITHEWSANTSSSTNTSSPAAVNHGNQHPIDVSVHLKRTDGTVELMLLGEVTITNTQKYPFVLPAQGVRLVLRKPDSDEVQYAAVTCPMAGNNILVKPMTDTPSTLVCEFKTPISEAWKKGTIQAQLQTLLSTAFEVDSGLPKSYDFDETASLQKIYQGECVSLHLTRVTNPTDLQSANDNPAVASLARTLGGERFRLLSAGQIASSSDGRVPPPATDEEAAPLVVCGDETVAWRETYGPWTEYDCGPNMALMGVSARPLTGPGDAVSATLAFPIGVQGCTVKPTITPMELRAASRETISWSVSQTTNPSGAVTVPRQKTLAVTYHVQYKRTASVSGFKVRGTFKVVNQNAATLGLESITYSISRPEGPAITGEADCSGTDGDGDSDSDGYPTDARISDSSQPMQPQALVRAVGTVPRHKAAKLKLAGVSAVKRSRQGAKGATGANHPVSYEDEQGSEDDAYEDDQGGSGPLYCSFEAQVPDDHPATVSVTVETDQGVKETTKLGILEWGKPQAAQGNKCALASFAFSNAANLIKPASIDGHAPPALAVKICEPKQYSFTANFGPWLGYGSQCGHKQAVSVATVSVPSTETVINSEESVNLQVVGCPEPLPVITVDASQTPIKGSYVWSITRRMTPVGTGRKNTDPAVTVAGPGAPTSETAVLSLSAKHHAGSQPGAYTKFNQTITFKRTKPAYEGEEKLYEVKGEVKLVNTADTPLHLKNVMVKIVCKSGTRKPITVKASCPQPSYGYEYDSDGGRPEGGQLTIPTTAGPDNPVKCKFGVLVPGPASVAVHGIAIMADNRKAKAKHSVHLELRQDFFKPSTLGSCIRIRERQQVRDTLTGADVRNLLFIQGHRIPEDGVEICKTKSFSFLGRIGPLESYEGEGCQAVSYESKVEAMPSSGYQGRLRNGGIVEVHTKSCKHAVEGDGSEDSSKTYKGSDYGKYKQPSNSYEGSSDHSYKGSGRGDFDDDGWEGWEGPGASGSGSGSDNDNDESYDGGAEDDSEYKGGSTPGSGFPPLPGSGGATPPTGGFPPLPGSSSGGSGSRDNYLGGDRAPGGGSSGGGGTPGGFPPLPGSSSGGGSNNNYMGGGGTGGKPGAGGGEAAPGLGAGTGAGSGSSGGSSSGPAADDSAGYDGSEGDDSYGDGDIEGRRDSTAPAAFIKRTTDSKGVPDFWSAQAKAQQT